MDRIHFVTSCPIILSYIFNILALCGIIGRRIIAEDEKSLQMLKLLSTRISKDSETLKWEAEACGKRDCHKTAFFVGD